MDNEKRVKLQVCLSLLAAVAILLLFFAPFMKVSLTSDTETLAGVLAVAKLKESEAEKDESESKAIGEKYESLSEQIAEGEAGSVSISTIGVIANFLDSLHIVSAWRQQQVIVVEERKIADKVLENPHYVISGSFEAEMEQLEEKKTELYEMIKPECFHAASVDYAHLTLTLMIQLVTGGENEIGQAGMLQDGTAFVVYLVFVIVKVVALLIFMFLFPIKALFNLFKMLISLKAESKDLGARYDLFMRNFKNILSGVGLYLAILFVWSAAPTLTGVGMLLIALGVIAFHALMARKKQYNPHERKFLDALQLCTAITVAGLALFAFFFAKADLIGFYTGNEVIEQIVENARGSELSFRLFMVLCLVSSFALFYICRNIVRVLTRLACMGDYEKGKDSGNCYAVVATGFFLLLLNTIVLIANGLSMPAGGTGYLVLAFLGILIAIGGQVLLTYFKIVKLPDLTEEETHAVLCGHTVGEHKTKKDD